jgi:CBS domain-containing protein
MLKDRYAAYPVVNDKGVVIGIISQHDLLGISTAFQSESGPRRGPKISSVMTRPAITVKRNDNITNVIKIMVEKNIGRIPVVDNSNVLIGIIDRSDIIRSFLKKMGETYV